MSKPIDYKKIEELSEALVNACRKDHVPIALSYIKGPDTDPEYCTKIVTPIDVDRHLNDDRISPAILLFSNSKFGIFPKREEYYDEKDFMVTLDDE